MQKIRIMLVDDNQDIKDMMLEHFRNNSQIEIIGHAKNGEECIEYLSSNSTDVDLLILDLLMPSKDGVAVLEYIKNSKVDVQVIVLTSYDTASMVKRVSNFDVHYYIIKPFNLKDLEMRILDIKNKTNASRTLDLKQGNLKQTVTKMLHELGVPSHIKGYLYIREAVTIVYENPDVIGAVTKELYPQIAEKYETTPSRVERAIRHAIEVSWNRGDWNLMDELFGNSVDIDKIKPTNSEFIVTIADKLKLDSFTVN